MSSINLDQQLPIELKVPLGMAQIILQALWTAPALLPYNQMQQVIETIQTQVQSQVDLHNAAVKEVVAPQ